WSLSNPSLAAMRRYQSAVFGGGGSLFCLAYMVTRVPMRDSSACSLLLGSLAQRRCGSVLRPNGLSALTVFHFMLTIATATAATTRIRLTRRTKLFTG